VGSKPEGLSTAEALRRLEKNGLNQVESAARKPVIWRLLKEFTQFFSVILWVASGLAFVADWLDPGQGMARIGYAVIAVIVVSGAFSFWQEYRIEQTLAALRKLLPKSVKMSEIPFDSDRMRQAGRACDAGRCGTVLQGRA
jgi:sodium/potassium-transporting ATPase subunit alpha